MLAIARARGFECYALSVHYGQRHSAELDAARRIAASLGAREHRVMGVDLAGIGGSALTDANVAVPESPTAGIPVTYVPARNTMLLSLALGWAEVVGARDIFVGVNAVDYSGYPDCRPEFIAGVRAAWRGWRPRPASRALLQDSGAAHCHVQGGHHPHRACELGVDYGMTVSCYQAERGRGRLRAMRFLPPACGWVSKPRACPIRRATADVRLAVNWRCTFGYHARLHGTVAQLVEQGPFKALVLGSSPSRPTNLFNEIIVL